MDPSHTIFDTQCNANDALALLITASVKVYILCLTLAKYNGRQASACVLCLMSFSGYKHVLCIENHAMSSNKCTLAVTLPNCLCLPYVDVHSVVARAVIMMFLQAQSMQKLRRRRCSKQHWQRRQLQSM